jgi:hypothetical protein
LNALPLIDRLSLGQPDRGRIASAKHLAFADRILVEHGLPRQSFFAAAFAI